MLLLLDNFDSFTYNLLHYFGQLGVGCKVLRNNVALEELEQVPFSGIVLSPGPGRPQDAGILMQVIEQYHQHVPMLGICLGHQALGEYFGAELVKGLKPMHGKLSTVHVNREGEKLFDKMPQQFDVVRYHSLVLQNLPQQLVPLAATTPDNELMALRHQHLPLYGVQYHPEAHLTSFGHQLLQNWVQLCLPSAEKNKV